MRVHKYTIHDKQSKNSFKSNKSSECIPCDACEYIAKGALDFSLHISKHQTTSLEQEKSFTIECTRCNLEFDTEKAHSKHVNEVHVLAVRRHCSDCFDFQVTL